jgi:hypothetical protein
MKRTKALAILMVCAITSSLAPAVLAESPEKSDTVPAGTQDLDLSSAKTTALTVKVDGKQKKVTMYEDCYVKHPTNVATVQNEDRIDQKLSIYVPENASGSSPILLYVNNAGWMSDAYAARTQVVNGKNYFSTSNTDKIGKALKKGYVIVSYGCRSRADTTDPSGKHISHSPATMTDTKAVIRYLRANAPRLKAGNPERIVVTGTSGGGALSTIIAASGNSSDYFQSLYEIGAAGITKHSNRTYTSSIRDDVFATIAYCPINDLREADAAYEWTYQDARNALYEDQDLADTGVDGKGNLFQDPLGMKLNGYNFTKQEAQAASKALALQYGQYVNQLGLKLDDGKTPLTSENLRDAVIGLLKDEINESADEIGGAQMQADVTGKFPAASDASVPAARNQDWITFRSEGSGPRASVTVDTSSFNYDKYLYYIASNKTLKVPMAFSNVGMGIAAQNEDNLFGTSDQAYTPYEFYSWNNDKDGENSAGKDETGKTWEEFMQTKEGKALALQLEMASPIPYLTNHTVSGSRDSLGDSAPYWYVRHGMADRDTSFALQTVLRYAITNDASIKDASFEFAWLKPHAGDYDVQEAYSWLDDAVKAADAADDAKKPSVPKPAPKKKAQAIRVSSKYLKKTYKAGTLKKSAKQYKIKVSVKGKAPVSFARKSGSKKISISRKGKVYIPKKLKKGTYKIKVKIHAAATKTYQAKTLTKTITIRVR